MYLSGASGMAWSDYSISGSKTLARSFCGLGESIIPGYRACISNLEGRGSSSPGGWSTLESRLIGSMNGEVRIWDVRAPEAPLYETVAQEHGLMALAVHTGAPVFATTSAAAGHANRQRLVIQGFSDPERPKTLSTIGMPLAPSYHAPSRPAGFMPSAASLVFHPVSHLHLLEPLLIKPGRNGRCRRRL